MKRMMEMCLAIVVLGLVFGCPDAGLDSGNGSPRKVMNQTFPDCKKRERVGASSGVKCEFEADVDEWRVSFWHGWGDCQAGCINTVIDARYVVDSDGRVYKAGQDFERHEELPPDTVIKIEDARIMEGKPRGFRR